MRKKLDTRFPAARIKKIMQADEDVGKIAMAVPVLVSKALELFLQDLCDRTYDITVQRGAKTVSALHLKKCVHSYNVFDFLKEVVNKVPDYGQSDTAADTSKRRKVVADESNDSDEESKRSNMEICHASSGRGRRGRGRGRGRGTRTTERELPRHEVESDSMTSIQDRGKQIPSPREAVDNCLEVKEASKENIKDSDGANSELRNIDLNAGAEEGADKIAPAAEAPTTSSAVAADVPADVKGVEYPGWSLSEMDRMAIDPHQLAQLNSKLDEDDEDYDEEGLE